MYDDEKLYVKIKHSFDLSNGGLKVTVGIHRVDVPILSTEIKYPEQQIIMAMSQHGFNLQQFIATSMADICQNMYVGLNKSIYHSYLLKTITKPKENVTVDSEVQTLSESRQTDQPETGGSAVAGS